jgi:glycosyltransferase involved in cell wall biosynthesis
LISAIASYLVEIVSCKILACAMVEEEKQHICVCVCTHKRPHLLKRTLEGIVCQETGGLFTHSIVVVDNDRLESARPAVSDFGAVCPVRVEYCVETDQNIAKARNKALEKATGSFIAFIDDDEFPTPNWLLTMFNFCLESGADGVLGPVKPHFDEPPPKWIIRGGFCDRNEHLTGFELDWRQTRTGNVLFRRKMIEDIAAPFRSEFGAGGEDQDFFRRMIQRGHRFVWCNEAVVYEVVPPQRWRRAYMLGRALQRGQNEKENVLTFGSLGKSLVAVPCYAVLVPVLLLVRHDIFMKCLIRLCDHAGKLLGAAGFKPVGGRYIGH